MVPPMKSALTMAWIAVLRVVRSRATPTHGAQPVKRARDQKSEPKRTIRHTETGGHSVDAREILQTDRAQELIKEVATRLKVRRSEESGR